MTRNSLPWILAPSTAALTFLPVLLALLVLLAPGCTGMLRDAAREVTPAVITGAVEGLADPDLQRRMVAAIDEQNVKLVSARLSAAMLDATLDTLEDPVRRARLEAIVTGLTARAAGAAIDAMLARSLDPKVQGRLQAALGDTLARLITVGFETVEAESSSAEARTRVLGVAAREIARQATLGFQEALDDTRRDRASGKMPEGDGALLIAAGSASDTGDRILWTLGIGLGALAFGLFLTLIWAVRKNRLRRSELAARDGALALLTEAIQAIAERPGAEELHEALKASIREHPGGSHLGAVLDRRGRSLLGLDATS